MARIKKNIQRFVNCWNNAIDKTEENFNNMAKSFGVKLGTPDETKEGLEWPMEDGTVLIRKNHRGKVQFLAPVKGGGARSVNPEIAKRITSALHALAHSYQGKKNSSLEYARLVWQDANKVERFVDFAGKNNSIRDLKAASSRAFLSYTRDIYDARSHEVILEIKPDGDSKRKTVIDLHDLINKEG